MVAVGVGVAVGDVAMNDFLVFVYQTLKQKGIREQALGSEARDIRIVSGTVKDFREIWVVQGTSRWPTLIPDPGAATAGDILFVDNRSFGKLDAWEARYMRRPIIAEDWGLCWVYMLKPTRNVEGQRK